MHFGKVTLQDFDCLLAGSTALVISGSRQAAAHTCIGNHHHRIRRQWDGAPFQTAGIKTQQMPGDAARAGKLVH